MTDIQAALDEIRAESAQREAEAEAQRQAEDQRIADLDAAKAVCAAACGPISEALADTTDSGERNALVELEARTHAEHAAALEAAYLTFAGQGTDDSNPATPGVTTPITSDIAAAGSAEA